MFEALDVAHSQRDVGLTSLQAFPFFDPYRADPRFQALLKNMNLT
jgi:hypothetical protein